MCKTRASFMLYPIMSYSERKIDLPALHSPGPCASERGKPSIALRFLNFDFCFTLYVHCKLSYEMKTKTRQRKPPITSQAKTTKGPSSSASPHTTASLIRRFHVLLKRRAQLEKRKASSENANLLKEVEDEIQRMGGLEAYQAMSSIGQGEDRGGGSEKVFVAWLKELGVQKEMAARKAKLRCV